MHALRTIKCIAFKVTGTTEFRIHFPETRSKLLATVGGRLQFPFLHSLHIQLTNFRVKHFQIGLTFHARSFSPPPFATFIFVCVHSS